MSNAENTAELFFEPRLSGSLATLITRCEPLNATRYVQDVSAQTDRVIEMVEKG